MSEQQATVKCACAFSAFTGELIKECPRHRTARTATASGYSEAYVTKLRAEIARLREAIELILPLAKGYAAMYPEIRSTQKYIEVARKALETVDEEKT